MWVQVNDNKGHRNPTPHVYFRSPPPLAKNNKLKADRPLPSDYPNMPLTTDAQITLR